jgi:hypothetical protein
VANCSNSLCDVESKQTEIQHTQKLRFDDDDDDDEDEAASRAFAPLAMFFADSACR